MNKPQIDEGGIVGDSYLHFHGGSQMDSAHTNVNHIDAGYLLYGAWDIKDIPIVHGYQFSGNLVNFGSVNSNDSLNLILIVTLHFLFPTMTLLLEPLIILVVPMFQER